MEPRIQYVKTSDGVSIAYYDTPGGGGWGTPGRERCCGSTSAWCGSVGVEG